MKERDEECFELCGARFGVRESVGDGLLLHVLPPPSWRPRRDSGACYWQVQEALVVTARKHLGGAGKVVPICRAIRVAREVAGMPQVELAKKLGVSQSMVARWEGSSEPLLSVVVRIERVLGLERGELLRAAGYVSDVVSVGRAVEEDPRLDDRARRVLLASYRSLTRVGGKV